MGTRHINLNETYSQNLEVDDFSDCGWLRMDDLLRHNANFQVSFPFRLRFKVVLEVKLIVDALEGMEIILVCTRTFSSPKANLGDGVI